MALSASAASTGRGSRAEKVKRIFECFDTNGDGGLDRNEMAALVVTVNPWVKFSEDQISAIIDEVFRTYVEFILPDGSSLPLSGLLRTYNDDDGDVDRDFVALSLPTVHSDSSSPNIAAGDAAAHSSPPSVSAAAWTTAVGGVAVAAFAGKMGACVQRGRQGHRRRSTLLP
jgi:hypothetical protein